MILRFLCGKKKKMKSKSRNINAIALVALICLFLDVHGALAEATYVVGHRGAAGLLPENTLAGFNKAIALGVDAIELDINLSEDGVAVVCHDFKLNPAITRDSNGKWVTETILIKHLSLTEIKSYDVGRLNPNSDYAARYPDQQPADGARIPTLREVIQAVKSANDKTKILIELKYSPLHPEESKPPEEIADVVAKVIQDENFTERAIVISFDWHILKYFQYIMPEAATGYVTAASRGFDTIQIGKSGTSPWMAGLDVDDFGSIPVAVKSAGGAYWVSNFRHTVGHNKPITSEMIGKAHELGIKVFVWTPDSISDMEKLLGIGVDGIITNRPDRLLAVSKK